MQPRLELEELETQRVLSPHVVTDSHYQIIIYTIMSELPADDIHKVIIIIRASDSANLTIILCACKRGYKRYASVCGCF